MAVKTWPAALTTGPVDYACEFDVQMSIYRSGRVTTFGLPGARWTCSLRIEPDSEHRIRPAIEALVMSLEGGANQLSMHHFGRPRPNGTLTGSPTVGSPITKGARSIVMANCNGGLKTGDIIGLPGQFVMVLADATPSFGNMAVSVSPTIRANHNSGTAITWNKPTVLWIPRSNIAGPFPYAQGKFRPGISIDFVEFWP